MIAARALAVALALVANVTPARAQEAQPTGEQILARAKAVFRAHVRAPFVRYTLERQDYVQGVLDLENTYTLKIWCRSLDRSAMLRKVWRGRAVGVPYTDTVAFDERVDPGPPTADIFERDLFGAPPKSAPSAGATAAPLIGTVAGRFELDYRVARATREGDAFDLALEPKRDPSRNRIDEMWVNASTFEVERIRLRDHLYFGLSPTALAEELDVRFRPLDGVPVITTIHGQSEDGIFQVQYRFSDIAMIESLPAWYFAEKSYRAHRSDVPE